MTTSAPPPCELNSVNRRILIVDDNPAIHSDIRKILCPAQVKDDSIDDLEGILFDEAPVRHEGLGFELFGAFQGQEALEMVRKAVAAAGTRTVERAVNVRMVAERLRSAIQTNDRITFRGGSDIAAVSSKGDAGYFVRGAAAGTAFVETFADVVNALWSGRLAIDRSNGLTAGRPWLYRTKLGIILRGRPDRPDVPSTTFVLGSYGDTVSYGDGSIYVSWYPDCLVGLSSDIESPDYVGALGAARKRELALRSIAAMSDLVPALAPYRDGADIEQVGGGIIFAWGAADIDDPVSELHRRYDIGVYSDGRYHSIDTGKYTMAPFFAVEACDRIEGSV